MVLFAWDSWGQSARRRTCPGESFRIALLPAEQGYFFLKEKVAKKNFNTLFCALQHQHFRTVTIVHS